MGFSTCQPPVLFCCCGLAIESASGLLALLTPSVVRCGKLQTVNHVDNLPAYFSQYNLMVGICGEQQVVLPEWLLPLQVLGAGLYLPREMM